MTTAMLENSMVIGKYPTGTDTRAQEARDEANARRWVQQAMTDARTADALIDTAYEWSFLEDAGPVLKSILHAVIRHREPASCITAEDRMEAMLAEIAGALETLGEAAVAMERKRGES